MPREKSAGSEAKAAPTKPVGRPRAGKALPKILEEKPTQLRIGPAMTAAPLLSPRPAPVIPVGIKPQPGISITVQIPALKRQSRQGKKAPVGLIQARKKRKLVSFVAAAAAVVVVGAGAFMVLQHAHSNVSTNQAVAAAPTRTAPDYQPLVPQDTNTTTAAYNGDKNLVSYNTNFNDARVTVSQQPLPANFTKDPTAILRAADSINAKQKVDTDHGTVFIADSTTDDSQMAIYSSGTVLMFIHTDKKLDSAAWKSFIEVLQAKNWQTINKG